MPPRPKRRRKCYMEPGSISSIPKATASRLFAVNDQIPSTCGPGATRPLPASSPLILQQDGCTELSVESTVGNENEPSSSSIHEASAMEDELESTIVHDPSTVRHCDEADSEHPFLTRAEFGVPFLDSGTLSRGDAYVMLLDYVLQVGMNWSDVVLLQQLINQLIQKKVLPESKYLFKKFFGVNPAEMTFHFYCQSCMNGVAQTSGGLEERRNVNAQCTSCMKKYTGKELMREGSFFATLPLDDQLKSLLSSASVSSALQKNLKTIAENCDGEHDTLRDITDGELYRKKRQELRMSPTDLTVTVNSDGSPMFKSSKYSIWPVQLTVNDLPPRLRWSNVVMPLLWYGKSHPSMTLLLQAFSDQLDKLNENGLVWKAEKEVMHSKVFCLCCCADAPARAAMQNVRQYNGYYGCSWCYHPGELVEGTVKYPVDAGPSPDRTEEEMLADMREATERDAVVRGVKGPSPMINLEGFDIVWSFSPDYMHCVLLGVSRQLTELWLSHPCEPYYVGDPKKLALIDGRLCSIRPPQSFNRLPRSLTFRKFWKAAEWQHWLLCYSLRCLQGILPATFLEHWELLVTGIFHLLKDEVTPEDIKIATENLVRFVVEMQFLYTKVALTYNVHQLLHLPKCVVQFGPLWAHSCFSFESNIGKLLKLVTSSNGVPIQIGLRVLLKSKLNAYMSNDAIKALASQKRQPLHEGIKPLGKAKKLDESSRRFFQQNTGCEGDKLLEYERMAVNNEVFHSDRYQRPTKTSCAAVRLGDGTYAKIDSIISSHGSNNEVQLFICSNEYKVLLSVTSTHIKKVVKRPRRRVYRVDEHILPCIFMSLQQDYFCDLVNRYEWS